MGGELISCSKISLCSVLDTITDRVNSHVEENRDDKVEEENEAKEVQNKKDEKILVKENKICTENEQGRESVKGKDEKGEKLRGSSELWGKDRSDTGDDSKDKSESKRSKLGGRWSKMGHDQFEEKESSDRRSRSESDLLSDLSRSV